MAKTNPYIQAIDLLTGPVELNYKQIVIELAKRHPTIFVKLAAGPGFKAEKWMYAVYDCMMGNRKDEAVKTLRAATGMGLTEAKDICDNIQNHLYPHAGVGYYVGAARLSDEHNVIALRIAKLKG